MQLAVSEFTVDANEKLNVKQGLSQKDVDTYAIVGETTSLAIRDVFEYLQANFQEANWYIPTSLLTKLLHAREHQNHAYIIATGA